MKKNKGITLVEVLVATALLVSISGIITLSLVAVFDGYAWMQKRSTLDQDGQYILARIKYASSQQDPQILTSQPTGVRFSAEGATLSGVQILPGNSESLSLSQGEAQGQYTSPIFTFTDPTTVGTLVSFVHRPAGSKIEYQIAIAQKVSGSCEGAQYVFIGPDKTTNTRFDTDYFLIPTDTNGVGYENPGTCMQYRAYLEKTVDSPTISQILFKK